MIDHPSDPISSTSQRTGFADEQLGTDESFDMDLLPTAELVDVGRNNFVDSEDNWNDADSLAVVLDEKSGRRSLIGRCVSGVTWLITSLFCIASLIGCLAVLTAIPIVQLIALGYLLDVAGRLAAGGKFRDSLPHLHSAGKIGLVVVAVFVGSLPVQLLVHWESVATLIAPGSNQAATLRTSAIIASFAGVLYLLWALARGGRLVHFIWPQPLQMLRRGWRPSTYRELPDKLWNFTGSLELGRFFWLGLRGAIGTLIWLVPAMIIIAANRNGETGLAGLVGGLALIALGVVMMYLPMLQAHFASENRFRALFEVRRIRRLFCYAPWAWLTAMILGLVLLPIPLYLLKIEATPREVVWLPTLVFVAFILPARLAEGLALRRATRIAKEYGDGAVKPTGKWNFFSRWIVRLLMPGVVGIYLLFVTLSQFTSWDGLQTWVQQHAILIPIPFLGGV
ncbi:MAG: DUF4013 domain-containing protein [Planctomycetales bacterium]|nr:DUF4013 domain-containing protein [Planctomycetales bacterium]